MPHDSSEWVSPKSMDFQVLGQKIYPIQEMIRPKMMPWSNKIYPLEGPKLIILLLKIEKSRKSVETDDDGPGGH